jgi:large subunit ribosomal protein L30
MAKVRLTQIISEIKRPQRQKDTLVALGITRMNQTVEKELSPQIEGMIKKVQHLLKVEML